MGKRTTHKLFNYLNRLPVEKTKFDWEITNPANLFQHSRKLSSDKFLINSTWFRLILTNTEDNTYLCYLTQLHQPSRFVLANKEVTLKLYANDQVTIGECIFKTDFAIRWVFWETNVKNLRFTLEVKRLDANITTITETLEYSSDNLDQMLQNEYRKYFFNKEKINFKLRIQGRIIGAHKIIVSTKSPYFRALIDDENSAGGDSETDVYELKENYDAIYNMIEFMYTNKLEPEKVTHSLLRVAKKFGVTDLLELCREHFKTNIINRKNSL